MLRWSILDREYQLLMPAFFGLPRVWSEQSLEMGTVRVSLTTTACFLMRIRIDCKHNFLAGVTLYVLRYEFSAKPLPPHTTHSLPPELNTMRLEKSDL